MKKILVMFLIILLCGCQTKYELTIHDDKTLEENFTFFETNENYRRSNENPDTYYLMLTDVYKKRVSENYRYKAKIGKKDTTISVSNQQLSMEEFPIKSLANLQLFSFMQLYEDNNQIILKAEGNKANSFFKVSDTSLYHEKITFVLNTHFPIIECNADEKDEIKGQYTWYFDIQNPDKEIKVVMNSKITFQKKLQLFFMKYWIIFALIIVLGLIGLFIYRKSKKNNQI